WARTAQQAGLRVLGIDRSPAMIELAKTVAPRCQFQCSSLYEARLPTCDVITALGEAFNYVGGRMSPLPQLFSMLAGALRPCVAQVSVSERPGLMADSGCCRGAWHSSVERKRSLARL